MAARLPAADVLLQAAANYLERELLPTLEGYHRFQTRVSVNALNIVLRELRAAAQDDAAEAARLAELLGHGGELATQNRELAEAIAEGRYALDDPRLRQHLRSTLRAALAINNPKWIGDD